MHGAVQRGTEIDRGVQRCTEVCVSVLRGVWRSERCMELHVQVHEGGKWRYMEGWTKVYKGLYEGVQRYAGVSGEVNWLPLPTNDLVGEIEAYFEVLYPFWVVDSLRTLKIHHYLSLVTIGCPSTHPAHFHAPLCTSALLHIPLCTQQYPLHTSMHLCKPLLTSMHLCTPPHTSMHLCIPLCAPLHTSAYLCTLQHISVHLYVPLHTSVHINIPLHNSQHEFH